jgi:hypothetical protein
MEKILVLACPKCHLRAEAVLDEAYHKFIVYTCPKCQSNVVFFKHKIDIIPDHLFKKLIKKRKLTFCGNVSFLCSEGQPDRQIRGPITKEDIIDLKILLETEKDSSGIISKL